MKEIMFRLLSVSALLFTAGNVLATECVWKADGTGGWSAETQWVDGIKPTQSGDTVTIAGEDVTATVLDGDVANFQLVSAVTIEKASSKLLINVTSDFSTPAVFSGSGQLEKSGASVMTLTTGGTGVRTTVGDLGRLVVSDGTFQMPNRSDSIQLPKVTVNSPGILSLGNSPATSSYGLWGDGTICNTNSNCQLYLYYSHRETPPVFSGNFTGKVQLTSYFVSSTPSIQYLTGSSDISLNLRMWGIFGAQTLGNKGAAGSLGTAEIPFRGPLAELRYLGTGETSNKDFSFFPDAGLSTVDTGANGGLTLNGAWNLPAYTSFGYWRYNTIVLTGSNTTTRSTMEATMYDKDERCTVYWRKQGTGIWRFGNAKPDIHGTFEVRRGTLQFWTIAEKGTASSLGTATRTGSDVGDLAGTQRTDAPRVDYAFRLGNTTASDSDSVGVDGDYLATMEYVGNVAGVCTSRVFAVDGAGRILTTGGALSLAGATAFKSGVNTLVLDGAGSDVFTSVTNGVGTLNIVKRGSGTWWLKQDIDVGAVVAEAGTLKLGTQYSFYRWHIKANNQGASGAWIASFRGFALMDEDGNLVNGNIGANGMANKNGVPETLLPGELCYNRYFGSTGDRYPSKSFHWLADEGKFEGNDPAAIDVSLKADDSSTWPIVYFRPDEGVLVSKYDILADGNSSRAVAQWELAGSDNGKDWVVLHTIDADNMPEMPMADKTWYSTKTTTRGGYAIDSMPSDTPSFTSICAHAGATVQILGTAAKTPVSRIVFDTANGAGTIKGGELAESGTIEVVGSVNDGSEYTFDGVTGTDRIANWTVTRNGRPSGWRIVPTATGFKVEPAAMIILFR